MDMQHYVDSMDDKWKDAYAQLVELLDNTLPIGFEKCFLYNMISYVVPLATYPSGYHVTPNTPLPFISIGVQKKHIAIYHMGIYANKELLNWFTENYQQQVPTKLNMGKSCIRFTNPHKIPFSLLQELFEKITPEQWITAYEKERNR
ncbi:DUF1801 domain-containing protein [Solibacillus sp. FSL H8-0538]|uniref:DUF1801 domain-containing protein n=1 Tax=Solibacillus sp. FSL H8-0538 TaxID=2921400 RepID=UPI0030FA8270